MVLYLVSVLVPEGGGEQDEYIKNLKTPEKHQECAYPFDPYWQTAPTHFWTQFVEWQAHIADAAQGYDDRVGHICSYCHHQGDGAETEEDVDGEEGQQAMDDGGWHGLAVELHREHGAWMHHPHKLVADNF